MTAWYAYALQIANGNLEALKLAALLVNFQLILPLFCVNTS